MLQAIQLFVGLANPGREYQATRHNAGSWFIEEIAQHFSTQLRMQSRYHGLYGLANVHQHPCHLLVPSTFMNLSGQSVRACASYHKISTESILVAHDEIDLPVGTIKLKLGGGDGGHNGLKDIIRHLQTKQFYRLRIGVGRPHIGEDVADYVLSQPSKADKQKIEDGIQKALASLPLIISGDMQKAMNQLHSES